MVHYLVLIILTGSFSAFHLSVLADVCVNTKVGQICGQADNVNFNGRNYHVHKFLGIPYAEPPTGKLRFAKPVPKGQFARSFKASRFGPACPQSPEQMKLWIPGDPYISEDCLSLNIFRPANSNGPYPVMIWLHGGAFVIGQSSIYSAENLASYTGVVVVTINYRLGPIGFLATDDDVAMGNYGLWDQQLAIRWVHDNIASFGGDDQSITLFGESAGGASAIYQAFYPPNKQLFHRLITESGVSLAPWAYGDKKKLGEYTKKLGHTLGCNSTVNRIIVDCLRKKPYLDIISHSRVGTLEEELFRPEWVPVVDNDFIKKLPTDIFTNPNSAPSDTMESFSSKDILVGTDSGDGSMVSLVSIIPYVVQKAKLPSYSGTMDVVDNFFLDSLVEENYGLKTKLLSDMISYVYTDWKDVNQAPTNDTVFRKIHDIIADTAFIVPTRITARVHSQFQTTSRKTYLFRFSHHSSYAPTIPWIPGCAHGDEIPYVFGFPDSMRKPYGYPVLSGFPPTEMSLSLAVMQYWSNFAKTGNPNASGLPFWSQFNTTVEEFMDLEAPVPKTDLKMYPERVALWTKLIPKMLPTIQRHNMSEMATLEHSHQLHINNILG